jgi:hypothetical protein
VVIEPDGRSPQVVSESLPDGFFARFVLLRLAVM